ncbi:MAG: TnsA endonuclease N-terminal domain-containing protein [Pyrinomonadaceae bacterium]
MRARTPKNSGTLKNIGKFPSLKNKSTVWFESHLERDFIYLIEFDKSVTKYLEQPFKVKYFINGKQHLYTPDFFLERQTEKQVIEIKPQSKIESEEFIHFSNHMKDFFFGEGYEYLVITDTTIWLQPKLSNIKLLWRYARMLITTKHQILIQELFENSSSIPFSEICSFLYEAKEQKELIYTLLFHGYLLTNIEKPITMQSLISIGDFN